MVTIPELTIQMLFTEIINPDHYYPAEVMELLESAGFKSLGWLNDGVFPPLLDDWVEVYQNVSGSYTIIASLNTKQIYCVDMGD
jgi:hypothetical protein